MGQLKEYRQNQNLLQSDLAKKMGVSQATVSEWESGDSLPSVTRIPKLAAILNVTEGKIIAAITAARKGETA